MRAKAVIVFLASALMCFAASASAVTTFEHIGAQCGFADNPLASHNRIHHVFKNTSGVGQWITCPVTRLGHNEVGWAALQSSQVISSVRLEVRNASAGSLLGWNATGFTSLNGGPAVEYYWPDWMNAGGGQSFAFEAFLPTSAFIYYYSLTDV